jgi:hypothetical protein
MTRKLQRLAKFVADSNGAFTEPQLRWWVHKGSENGLNASGAVIRVGRCVYLDVDAFDSWLASQSAAAA